MSHRLAFSVLALAVTAATPALAYVGPGAGLSLLGALWALVLAIGAALLFLVAWPLRRMRRRRREQAAAADLTAEPAAALPTEQSSETGR